MCVQTGVLVIIVWVIVYVLRGRVELGVSVG
jgi:hypothetical protein